MAHRDPYFLARHPDPPASHKQNLSEVTLPASAVLAASINECATCSFKITLFVTSWACFLELILSLAVPSLLPEAEGDCALQIFSSLALVTTCSVSLSAHYSKNSLDYGL